MLPAATVTVWGATGAMAVLGDTLAFVLGTSARGVLREGSPAVVVGRVCPVDEGPKDGPAMVVGRVCSVDEGPEDGPAMVVGRVCPVDEGPEDGPATVVGRVCTADEGPEDVGAVRVLEVTLSVVPSLVVGVLVFVLCIVISAVILVEFRVAAQVPVVNVTGAGGTVAILSADVLSALGTVSLGML